MEFLAFIDSVAKRSCRVRSEVSPRPNKLYRNNVMGLMRTDVTVSPSKIKADCYTNSVKKP